MQAHRRMMLPVHSLVCLAVFGLSLPLAISLFPQMSQVIPSTSYEREREKRALLFSANTSCSFFNFVCRPPLLIFVRVCAMNNVIAGNCLLLIFFCSLQIEASHLEPEIAMATDCKVLTYNKGL